MKANILIVEDELIFAHDLKENLEKLGYVVAGIVADGERVLQETERHKPQLVLMDIRIRGKKDGIQAAEELRNHQLPVIFLTAFADEETFQKAKITGPFGYILKPLHDLRLLEITIEIALYKADMEKRLRKSEENFKAIADYTHNWEDWVSPDGVLLWLNPAVSRLTGYTQEECFAKPDYPFFMFEEQNNIFEREQESNDYTLYIFTKEGNRKWVSVSWQKIYDPQGKHLGRRTSYRDVTLRKIVEEEKERLIIELQDALAKVKTLSGLLPICASCKKIRDDQGYWHQVETYIKNHSDAEFTHGICPDCMNKLYGEYLKNYSEENF